MENSKEKFKKGAASFYIVAFSTLILLVVATSFAAIIISELNRTLNEDLSQSAYDSAMAGVEDAKLAYYSYQNCVTNNEINNDPNNDMFKKCEIIKNVIEEPANWKCNMVDYILGRINDDDFANGTNGVMIQESNTNNNMVQEYTCVTIRTKLRDYRSNLSSSNQLKVIQTNFEEPDVADKVDRIKISWYENDGSTLIYNNFNNSSVTFPSVVTAPMATPPTISVAVLQTAENFRLSDFDTTVGDRTNRGMVYLVPVPANKSDAAGKDGDNYKGAYKNGENIIRSDALRKSNDKTAVNLPYAVYCGSENEVNDEEFVCSATIELPRPLIDAANSNADMTKRNKDTFMVVVSLPYGGPSTNFAVEFLCGDGCRELKEGEETQDPNIAYLDGVQVEVDSTGRANDLYRRVKTRLQSLADSSFLSIMGPLELLGGNNGNESLLQKTDAVTSEWNFH